jgi:hypothetical protein
MKLCRTILMDVMGVANELMLDRLSQICQEVIGRFGESSMSSTKFSDNSANTFQSIPATFHSF